VEKPAKIPAPVPEAAADEAPQPAAAAAPAAPKAMSKIEMIRAKQRGESVEGAAAAAPAPAAAAPAAAAKPAGGKKAKKAEARPSLVWLGMPGLTETAAALNSAFGEGTATIVQAALLVPPEKLVEVALYLRDKNKIKYNYLASLQSVHFED